MSPPIAITSFTPGDIGAAVAGLLVSAWALLQTRRAEKAKLETQKVQAVAEEAKKLLASVSSDDLAKKNEELAKAYCQKSEEWQAAWKKEHEENQAYRSLVHTQRNQAQAEHLKLVEENASLRARTDLTPIISHIEKQQETNERVATALTQLTSGINSLMQAIYRRETEREETT